MPIVYIGVFYTCKQVIVLVRISIAVKRHQDHGNSYKGQHSIGPGLQFRGLVHYLHGSVKADMVLEKELRVLRLDPRAAEATVCHTGHSLGICESQNPPLM